MSVRHLRPKYVAEQYVVVFKFNGVISGRPVVLSELVSGDDPEYATVAGWAYTSGGDVGVVIANGVAGCIYKILCKVNIAGGLDQQEGIVAVYPDDAIDPPGFDIIPHSTTASSQMFPVQLLSSARLGATILGGSLTGVVVSGKFKASAKVAVTISIGSLYEIAAPQPEPSLINLKASIVEGRLVPPPSGQYSSKAFLVCAISNGQLKETPQGRLPDKVNISVTITGGRLFT